MVFDRILFASGNRHKYMEVRDYLKPLGFEILFGGDMLTLEIEETGMSYSENAILKARAWAEISGLPCLADDSGLEIRSLNWWPGVFSARIASTDCERNEMVLSRMSDQVDRICRYVASFALIFPQKHSLWLTQGICWGTISRQPMGKAGFGYDPIFIPEGHKRTLGELGLEVKATLSHRSVAASALVDMLSSSSVIK